MKHSHRLIGLLSCAVALSPAFAGCSLNSSGTSESPPPSSADSATGAGGADGETSASAGAGGSDVDHAGAGGGGPPACAPGRVTDDRPDDFNGYQIHVNYVLPSDGIDEELDTNGLIETSVASFTRWFKAQAAGRSLRLDTCDGKLDVRFLRLSDTASSLKTKGVGILQHIERALKHRDPINPRKIEAVYYGAEMEDICATSPTPPSYPGHVVMIFPKGTLTSPMPTPCAQSQVGASAAQPGHIDMLMLWAVVHALGVAAPCAPHYRDGGLVTDSAADLLSAAAPSASSVLDAGRDDYLDHHIRDCLDLGKSVFIEPLPQGAQTPPGW
jgi:hypothetical protein